MADTSQKGMAKAFITMSFSIFWHPQQSKSLLVYTCGVVERDFNRHREVVSLKTAVVYTGANVANIHLTVISMNYAIQCVVCDHL